MCERAEPSSHKKRRRIKPDAVDTVITVNQHFDELSCFE